MITVLLAVAFALEWNPTYRTDVPYEVELNPAKIGAESFAVFADGRELSVTTFAGRAPGTLDLRFAVPAGTRTLTCESRAGRAKLSDSAAIDNVFAGALDAANLGRWELERGVKAEPIPGGFLFTAPKTEARTDGVSCTVDIPASLAGKPVVQEIDVENRAQLVWCGRACVEQLDAQGNRLPETVVDPRWTTHMRPVGRVTAYRNEGHIHPKARKLRFVVRVRNAAAKYDAYGLAITDHEVTRGRLAVTRLAVRPAELLPFPKWNDSFFGPGVSGEPGDASLRLGGEKRRALFYQACSRAAWSQRHEFDDDADRALPAGAGTVEAFFRPDWKAFAGKAVTLFSAYHGYSAATHEKPKQTMLGLDYSPADKTFRIELCDYLRHRFKGEVKGVELPDGKWTHVALQWEPGGKAEFYIDGRRRGELPIAGFEAVPLKDKALLKKLRSLNDAWAMEFFLGASCETARLSETGSGAYFEGECDALRVSRGLRYSGDFTPDRRPSADDRTCVSFSFDRVFDGVMGGGFGFIPASVRADEDRVDHALRLADGKVIEYYPRQPLPENDPDKVLDILNYPVMPTEAEYRAARALKTRKAVVKPGDRVTVRAGAKAYPAYTEFRNLSKTEPLRYPIAVADGRLDPRSFGDLADTLGLDGLSDRERVNRVFQYMISSSDYFANYQIHFDPGSDSPRSVCYEAMVVLNGYCGFECGPLNNMTANLMSTVARCPAGVTGGYGHEFEQVFYDGKNHIYDLSAQKFFPAFDNETAAYLKEMGDQPGLKQRGYKSPDHFIRKGTRGYWVNAPCYQEKAAMTVNPGETLRIRYMNCGTANNLQSKAKSGLYGGALSAWEQDYARVCGADDATKWAFRKDRIFTHRSAAVTTFDGRPEAVNPAFGEADGASFCYRVKSCYPIVWGEYAARLAKGGFAALEISTDRGRTFRPLPAGKDGVARSEYLVKGRLEYLVRVKAPIASVARFTARTEGEVNPRTYPGWVMKGGETAFTFKAEPGAEAEMTIAWREPVKDVTVGGTAKSGTVPGFERELVLVDPAKPLVLPVEGASAAAKVRTSGRLAASLREGRLTLAYDRTKAPAVKRGLDDPEPVAEFPQFAAVDIVDGEAVKSVTAVIAPGGRLAFAEDPLITEAVKPLKFERIPAGRYALFALGRFNSDPQGVVGIDFVGPTANGKKLGKNGRGAYVCRYRNVLEDYRKAGYGRPGGRSRWKWDMPNNDYGKGGSGNAGADYRIFDLPETDHLDFRLPWKNREGESVELAAVLLLPEPGKDFFLDARKILFGYNCDPFHED